MRQLDLVLFCALILVELQVEICVLREGGEEGKKKEGGRNALQLCEDKKEKKRKGGDNKGMSVELRDAIMMNFKLF